MGDTALCGKLPCLKKILRHHHQRGDKILLFSSRTRILDVLQTVVEQLGFTFCRLDGGTATADRGALMDQFNGSPNMFLMLISTKAGGLGLNLTSANVVIQFNPTWNPAHDVQAQDRAFRIGQRRHVTVYRLISMGTVDELMYMRQINKITVGNHTLTGASATRLYEGVSGETHGDLFGIENIFRYSRSGFEQSHLVHRRSERRKYFRLVDRGTVQSERSASHKQQSAISQPTSKALLTRPQIDDVVSQLEHIYMDVAPEKLRQLPNIRTKLKTGALSFEFLAKQVAELPDPTDGSPPHVLRLQLQSCNPPAGSALKPESAMAPEVFTWRRDDDTLSFESEGGFVVDGDMFHQVRCVVFCCFADVICYVQAGG
eukprot:INCI9952.6.p1 GENE.INCI9952.6~~INCI9952.6.p1  ORF type:complete len:388 (-),score=70.54 INCI9952.6:419-1537(-)